MRVSQRQLVEDELPHHRQAVDGKHRAPELPVERAIVVVESDEAARAAGALFAAGHL
jgi:hypothetical protein